MSDHEAAVRGLVADAEGLPEGAGKVALYQEAIALADARRDAALAFDVREDALWAFYRGDRTDVLLVEFAWCLAHLDRDPTTPAVRLLWSYRWVVDVMPNFPEFSRNQIDAAWADMRRRYAEHGYSLRPVWLNRRLHLMALGDGPGAADAHRRHARLRPGFLCDDADQDAAFAVGYAEFRRRDRGVIAAAQPFLDGRIKCAELEIGVLDRVLLPLARLGRASDAVPLRARAARLAATRPEFLGSGDMALTFLTITGDLAGAVRHFDRHFTPAHDEPGALSQLSTYQHALFFAREVVRRNRSPALKVPAGLIPGVSGTRTTPGPLRDWLEVALPELCARADARNGNGYYTGRLVELDEYTRLARALGG